jgi:hypothetical protein
MDKAYVVPLHELLAGVPRGTRLEINDPDGMGTRFIPVGRYCHEAAEALRARLAQPESEPFEYWNAVEGWVKIEEVRQHFDTAGCGTIYKTGGEGRVPLYTTPQREWVGLTDLEISKIYDDCNDWEHYEYERAIEAKLKEKNGV